MFVLVACGQSPVKQVKAAPAWVGGVEIAECPPGFALPDDSGDVVHLSDLNSEAVVAVLFTGW